MVNGYTSLAVTKLDILDKMDEIKVGVTYIKNGAALEHFPSCEQVNSIFHSFNPKRLGEGEICLLVNETTFFSLKLFLLIALGPRKPQKLTASKFKYESFGPKFLIPDWKMDILVP